MEIKNLEITGGRLSVYGAAKPQLPELAVHLEYRPSVGFSSFGVYLTKEDARMLGELLLAASDGVK